MPRGRSVSPKHRSREESNSRRKYSSSSKSGQMSRKEDRKHRDRRRRDDSSGSESSGHHRRRNRRHDSESSSDEEIKASDMMQRLELKRQRTLEEKIREKEKMKALETPEEKFARRLAKKQAKELQKKMQKSASGTEEYIQYTNDDNPFGDSNLTETFVWTKKLQSKGVVEVDREQLQKEARRKLEENRRELEKVKERRLQREKEKAEREKEMEIEQRSREAVQFNQWRMQEDDFHLQQARLRSRIRIQDGRGKPIDYLAQYIAAEEDLEQLEPYEPYAYLQGITISDMEDLIEDIKVYKELEKGKHQDYWADLTVIAEEELRKLRKMDRKEYEASLGRREGINQAVQQDVLAIFKGKTAEQLAELKTKIEEKLRSRTEGIDVNYWESLLSQLKAHIARARLRDRHQENLKRKVSELKAQQGVKATDEGEKDVEREVAGQSSLPTLVQKVEARETEAGEEETADTELEADIEKQERELLQRQIEEYVAGGYSPVYLKPSDLELGTLVIDEAEDTQRLHFSRKQVTTMGKKVEDAMTAEERRCEQEAKKGMADDEARFSVESNIDQNYSWSDKYRPRKPRYFNRVHTGFEWNKYNQTHYDIDNPPPKIVQGYKFNIFYPDLIDKNITPQYTVTPCADNKEFAILRISAGPPYEDIAFKIVNREWEYSYKRGFRCQFHNNIFQMWFHFKRYRYRR